MSFLQDFHFIRPAWLLLIPVALGIWWTRRSIDDPLRAWRKVVDPELLTAMTLGADARSKWRGLGPLVAILIGIVAVAGPTWRPEPSPFADDPAPAMVLLKADKTMDLSDLSPSRMERARLKVTDFAKARPGEPMGLIAYSGSAHLVLPPTRDTGAVAEMASHINPEIMPKEGDDPSKALDLAVNTLAKTGGGVIVIADTVDSSAMTALKDFRSKHRLPVHILGIARPDTPEMDALKEASRALGGSLVPMTADTSDVESLARKVAGVPRMVAAKDGKVRWAEAGWNLTPVLALLVLVSFRKTRSEIQEGPAS
ncbi:MAG: VWA domain-containing protein [Candidatus Omnitrophica bacterium]|nr:VWA domain-containing protein [Candidatus Omnitrophota bacterium]